MPGLKDKVLNKKTEAKSVLNEMSSSLKDNSNTGYILIEGTKKTLRTLPLLLDYVCVAVGTMLLTRMYFC